MQVRSSHCLGLQVGMPQPQQVPGSSGWEAPAAFDDARGSADLNHSQPEGLLRGGMSSELQQQVHRSQPVHMHMDKGLPSQSLGLGVHTPEQPPQQKAPGPTRAEAQQQPQHKVGQLSCPAGAHWLLLQVMAACPRLWLRHCCGPGCLVIACWLHGWLASGMTHSSPQTGILLPCCLTCPAAFRACGLRTGLPNPSSKLLRHAVQKPQQEEQEWQEVAAQLQPVPQGQQKPDPIAAPKRSGPGGPVGPVGPVSRPAPAAASKPAEEAGRPWGPAPTVQDFTERMFGGQGDSSQALQAQLEPKVAPWAGSRQGGAGGLCMVLSHKGPVGAGLTLALVIPLRNAFAAAQVHCPAPPMHHFLDGRAGSGLAPNVSLGHRNLLHGSGVHMKACSGLQAMPRRGCSPRLPLVCKCCLPCMAQLWPAGDSKSLVDIQKEEAAQAAAQRAAQPPPPPPAAPQLTGWARATAAPMPSTGETPGAAELGMCSPVVGRQVCAASCTGRDLLLQAICAHWQP